MGDLLIADRLIAAESQKFWKILDSRRVNLIRAWRGWFSRVLKKQKERDREKEKWERGCFVRSPSTCSPGPFFCQSPRDPCNFLSRKPRRGFNAPLSQLPSRLAVHRTGLLPAVYSHYFNYEQRFSSRAD